MIFTECRYTGVDTHSCCLECALAFPRDPPRSSRRLKMSYRLTAVCSSAGGHRGSMASKLPSSNGEKAKGREREKEKEGGRQEDPERAECGLDTLHRLGLVKRVRRPRSRSRAPASHFSKKEGKGETKRKREREREKAARFMSGGLGTQGRQRRHGPSSSPRGKFL